MQHSIYREEILEHYKDPQNFGKLQNFDVSSRQLNPFCGDGIVMYIKQDDGKVSGITFEGQGCAVSIAGASLLTEYAKGKTVERLRNTSESDMLTMLAIEVSETRKKCALLAFYALRDCLNMKGKNQKLKVKSTS